MTNNALVPRIIHQVWIGGEPSANITECLKTVQDINSTFEYYLWDEEKLLNDFCEQFPKQKDKLLKLLNLQISSAAKVDLIRFIILYEIGGIYIDADFQFINPIPHRFLESEVILAAEPFGLTNALIGMTPRHPLAKRMVDTVWRNICEIDITSTNIVSMTGPVQFQQVVNQIGLYNNFKTFIIPPHIIGLVPFQKKYFLKNFYNNSNFENNLPADIIAIHHYEGSWKPNNKSLLYPIVYPIKSLLLRKYLISRKKNGEKYV